MAPRLGKATFGWKAAKDPAITKQGEAIAAAKNVFDGGLFTRPIRVMVLAVGLFSGQLHITLWVLAIGVQLSAFVRLLGVCAEARRKECPESLPSHFRWFKGRAARPLLGKADDGESPVV